MLFLSSRLLVAITPGGASKNLDERPTNANKFVKPSLGEGHEASVSMFIKKTSLFLTMSDKFSFLRFTT